MVTPQQREATQQRSYHRCVHLLTRALKGNERNACAALFSIMLVRNVSSLLLLQFHRRALYAVDSGAPTLLERTHAVIVDVHERQANNGEYRQNRTRKGLSYCKRLFGESGDKPFTPQKCVPSFVWKRRPKVISLRLILGFCRE